MRLARTAFGHLFIILVVLLMVLPFWVTFNEFLTKLLESISLYRPIENILVPYEVTLVRTIISFFGIETAPGTVAVVRNGVQYGTFISWNCIGWQSFLILLISLKAGLSKEFTTATKAETVLLALLGTFFMNLFRISLVLIVLYYFGKFPASLFHDYVSVFITIAWLFFFWWFSYKFVLEVRKERG